MPLVLLIDTYDVKKSKANIKNLTLLFNFFKFIFATYKA